MAEYTLMTVFNQMGFFDPTIPDTLKGNIEDSITFAKAATRAGVQGGDHTAPINLKTLEYYKYYLKSIQEAAWNVRQQATQQLNSQGGSIKTNDLITSLLQGVGLPSAQLTAMTNMWNALEASSSTSVNSFISFFWQNSNQYYKNTQFMVSPWYMNENGNVEMCVTFFGYEEKITSWRSLFVGQHQESLVGQVQSFRAEFFTKTWSEIGPGIHDRVSGGEKKVVQKTPLSF